MREFFRTNRTEAIIFIACTVLYTAIVFGWNLSHLADSDLTFIRGTPVQGSTVREGVIPVIGELPAQSISKIVITGALYLIALAYALIVVAIGNYRKSLPQIAGLAVLTFLTWMALNFWVISGFLGGPIFYGVIAVVLQLVWGGAVMRFVAREHDATAVFLVRFGLGLAMFVSIVQVLATLTPEWRTPTQGVPVLYTMTLNAMVGMIIAGVGGNMLWSERREQLLAAASKKR